MKPLLNLQLGNCTLNITQHASYIQALFSITRDILITNIKNSRFFSKQQMNTSHIIGQSRILVPNNYFVRVNIYVYFTLLVEMLITFKEFYSAYYVYSFIVLDVT